MTRSLFLLLLSAPFAAADDSASSVLWYRQPAKKWMTEALPVGNGALGGMIFGGLDRERVQFNEISLWEGDDKSEGTGAYQAFGDLFIELGHEDAVDYRRELDIDRAVHRVSYKRGGVKYERTAFSSRPMRVMVIRLGADAPGGYTGVIRLADKHGAKITVKNERVCSVGKLKNGLDYEAQLLVLNEGGKVEDRPDDGVAFEKCDRLTLILAAGTSYIPDYKKNWRGEHPHREVTWWIDAAVERGFDKLLDWHVKDYQSLFRRFRIDLGATAPDLAAKPTDERLAAYSRDKAVDPDLEELFCQYGRYLLISSSRPDAATTTPTSKSR